MVRKQETGRVYGYTRVSTFKQDGERQVKEILDYAAAHDLGDVTIFRETVSAVKAKPELERALSLLKPGDTLAVWELSRLTRSGMTALFTVAGRIRDSGAYLLETKSGLTIGNDMVGEIYLMALGLSSRIEREMISERTKSALRVRKQQGMKLGRPAGKSKLDKRREEIAGYQKLELTVSKIARLLGVARSTYEAWLKKEAAAQGEKG